MIPLLTLHSALAGEPTGENLKYCWSEWDELEKKSIDMCGTTPSPKLESPEMAPLQKEVGVKVSAALVKRCAGLKVLNPGGKANFGDYYAAQEWKDQSGETRTRPEEKAGYMGTFFLVSANKFESMKCGVSKPPVLEGFTKGDYGFCDTENCYRVSNLTPYGATQNYPDLVPANTPETATFLQVVVEPNRK